MSKFNGTWYIMKTKITDGQIFTDIVDKDNDVIATMFCRDDSQNEEARLIANAPEMYEILKGLPFKLKANGADEREEIDEAIQEIERLIERIDGKEHEELHGVEAQEWLTK